MCGFRLVAKIQYLDSEESTEEKLCLFQCTGECWNTILLFPGPLCFFYFAIMDEIAKNDEAHSERF